MILQCCSVGNSRFLKFVFLAVTKFKNFNTRPSFLPMLVAFCASWEGTTSTEGHGKMQLANGKRVEGIVGGLRV